jgi:signal transduction histidine kinase
VLLEAKKTDDRAHALIERIASSANSAIHLIEELLSAKRIEEGALFLKPYLHDIRPVVEQIVSTFALSARTKEIHLTFAASDAEVRACVDTLAFERVISNLLSNAIKFTQKGGTVSLVVCRVADGAMISVKDSGQGLEPLDAQRLFQRFSRLSQHATVAGSGLGLFIVKSIVSAHGGSIDVSSSVGKGSTFEVFFPDSPPLNDRGEVLCVDCA